VREGHNVPAGVVIGEYTEELKVVRGRRKKQDSQSIIDIHKATFIDAEKEGNCTRHINHTS
jgi:hypothetical protein